MKKVYEKPMIVFENFSLSTNIAADCDVIITGHSQGTCGIKFEDTYLFAEGYSGCITPIAANQENDSLCYHVPSVTTNMFNS